jgi:radical SAM superfamily enzyme YgiQ (UPF0313 family)
MRRDPKVVLVGIDPWLEDAPDFRPFNYGVYRVFAALHSDCDVSLVDVSIDATADLTERVLALEPDIVGLSAYVWSMPELWRLAREVRRARPEVWIVLGGPCARPALLALAPYAGPTPIDALVVGRGEGTMRDIVRARAEGRGLDSVPGVLVVDGSSVRASMAKKADREARPVSPFQLGLVPPSLTGHLERFSGCPLACRFCQWGELDASNLMTAEVLERELEALRAANARGAMIVDAGLNLHAAAFRNLVEAEERTSFLRDTTLHCELYPSAIREEHLEFLSGVDAKVGVGLQSYDQTVLSEIDRHAPVGEFEAVLERIASVAEPTVEMILGLPGDNPSTFRASFERACSFGVDVRVYQCLVLPDALMTRSKPEWNVAFDPITLEMQSCSGWSEEALRDERENLTERARSEGGFAGYSWWQFRPRRDQPRTR